MNISIRRFFRFSWIFLVTLTLKNVVDATIENADRLPNLVIIFCDDLGYGDLSCYGHPTISTPHLDQMAQEGQRWTQFYVGASVCTPSRAALLTGRLPNRSGMMSSVNGVLFPNSTGGLPESEITIAELLNKKGYHTAAIGKWHLGHHQEHLPTNHGFDYYWGIPYSNDMDNEEKWGHYRVRAEKDALYEARQGQYDVPILEGTEEIERPANQRTITARYTEKTIEFIRDHREEPFFVYLAHSMVHVPLYSSDAYRGSSIRGSFGDVMAEIDAGVGNILNELKQLNLEKNTLVVFTSDNGPWLLYRTHGGSSGPLKAGKGTTFEGGMRVPAIFWQPSRVIPGVQHAVGTTMDLLPTICEMAGIETPKDREMDGMSVLSDLNHSVDSLSDHCERIVYYWRANELYAIRKGPWKLHFITQGSYGMGEGKTVHPEAKLFQLEQDPGEQWDLAQDHPDIVKALTLEAGNHKKTVLPVKDQLAERI